MLLERCDTAKEFELKPRFFKFHEIDFRRRNFQDVRMCTGDVQQDFFNFSDVRTVRNIDLNNHPHCRTGKRIIYDARFNQFTVWNDKEVIVRIHDLCAAKTDLKNIPFFPGGNFHAVPLAERTVEHDDEPRNHVRDCLLRSQTYCQ